MRRLALLLLLACGSSKTDEPRCADALKALATRVGAAEADSAPTIGICEQGKWPQSVRKCVADAATARAAAVCVKPVLDDDEAVHDEARQLGPAPVPSKETKEAAGKIKVRALVFAKPGRIAEHVRTYLGAAGIAAELADRFVDVERAKKYRVARDVIVLVRETDGEERHHTIDLADEPKRARLAFQRLDRDVAYALAKLAREKRKAYVTAGHGEQTERQTKLNQQLGDLNFVGGTLAAADLAKDVPADATVVMILAPMTALSAEEQAALGRYLDRGGSLLVALEPKGIASLGALDARLGVKLAPGKLTDETSFLPQRKTAADHRFVVTTKYSAHPTTAALARASGQSMVIVEGGALESVAGSAAKLDVVIRSMPTSFLDLDDDFTFDDGKEKRETRDLAAAVGDKFRAFVIADVDVFSDVVVAGSRAMVVMLGGPLFGDVMRWLAKEDQMTPIPDPIENAEPAPEERGPRVMRAFIDFLDAEPKDRDKALEQLEKLENKSRAKP